MDAVDGKAIIPIVRKNIAKEAVVMTDDAGYYKYLGAGFAGHEIVRHSKSQYGYGPIHTNTVEGFAKSRSMAQPYCFARQMKRGSKPVQNKSQSKRFIEKARELGCDESEAAFDQQLKKIAKAPAGSGDPKTQWGEAQKAPRQIGVGLL